MSPIKLHRLTLSGYIKIAFLILGLAAAVWYIHFQARYFIAGPQVSLESPTGTVQNRQIIDVSGVAQNITDITLNGRKIYTDESGHFTEPLVLEHGYTIMTIVAKDRFGRFTSLSKEFFFEEPAPHAFVH